MQKTHQRSVIVQSEPVNKKAKKKYSRRKLQALFRRNQKHLQCYPLRDEPLQRKQQ